MKKIMIIMICVFMLAGCSSGKTINQEEVYNELYEKGIVVGLFPGDNPNASISNDEGNWIFTFDSNDKLEMIFEMARNIVVYDSRSEDVESSEEYDDILRETGLTQDELAQFLLQYYKDNTNKAKGNE